MQKSCHKDIFSVYSFKNFFQTFIPAPTEKFVTKAKSPLFKKKTSNFWFIIKSVMRKRCLSITHSLLIGDAILHHHTLAIIRIMPEGIISDKGLQQGCIILITDFSFCGKIYGFFTFYWYQFDICKKMKDYWEEESWIHLVILPMKNVLKKED